MPWMRAAARSKTHKADTPAKQSQWAAIANRVLEKTGDDGKAIRIANGVIGRRAKKRG